jgi:hypothetical protein
MTEKKVLEIHDARGLVWVYSPSPTTEHDTLLDHVRGLIDHSPTMLGDLSTMSYAVLGDCFDHSPTIA